MKWLSISYSCCVFSATRSLDDGIPEVLVISCGIVDHVVNLVPPVEAVGVQNIQRLKAVVEHTPARCELPFSAVSRRSPPPPGAHANPDTGSPIVFVRNIRLRLPAENPGCKPRFGLKSPVVLNERTEIDLAEAYIRFACAHAEQ